MADLGCPVRQAGKRRALNAALLGGASLLALMLGKEPVDARSLSTLGSIAPTAAAQQAAIAAAQQAAGAAAQAQASMSRAAAALAAMRKLQSDAAAAAQASSSSVPNGLTPGGLMPAGGTASDPFAGVKADPTKLVGVDSVSQTSNASGVSVDIHQTQQKAILYWDTFNVGAKTTVNFQQQNSSWIALNRVIDPAASPSKILGQVNALGGVYIINPNGIIFGAGAQINVNTLIASSLDIGKLGSSLTDRDQFFANTGAANANSFSFYDPATSGSATSNAVAGNITVERGASINATIATDNGAQGSAGAVYLFGANVSNSGAISAPTGEVAMVAARTIDFIPGGFSVLPASVLGTDSKGNVLKMRGTEFSISHFASAYDTAPTTGDKINPHFGYPAATSSKYLLGTGVVSHDGLIDASRGIVIMNGDTVSIDNPGGGTLRDSAGNLVQSVIAVDTSIDRNSMVLLRAATSVTMNGVITSLPFDDGAQPLPSGASAGSAVQSFTPAYIEMSAQSTVTVGSSALVSAPSAQVVLRAIDLSPAESALSTIYLSSGANGSTPIYNNHLFNQSGNNNDVDSNTSQSPQTVLLAPGATIDVSGLRNVELPASYNFISFQPRAEFADMPLQRSGPLYGQTLWIDIRASGTRSDGTSWVGTPLADASGYVNAVGRSIYQLMTVGGSVSMSTDLGTNNGGGRVQTAGSVINVAGGSVNFLPGMVNTTRLLGIDGRIYSMASADPNMTYVGIAGQFTVNHARWGVKETWSTGTQTYSPGYSEGQAAGGVSITTVTPSLDGTMYFGSVAGERQLNSGKPPSQGTLTLTTPSSVQIGSAPSADYTTQSALTTVLSADTLSGYGLSGLTVTANDLVVSGGSTLNLAAGGSFSVTAGGAIDVAGTVSAAGGSITLLTNRNDITAKFGSLFKAPENGSGTITAANVYVEGTLDVSGRFVNDTGRTSANMSGPGYIDGGTISIATNKSSDNRRDVSGSILLAEGSVLDVSSGGYISPLGKPKTVSAGVMAGKAGAISLSLYQGVNWKRLEPGNSGNLDTIPASGPTAVLQLDGSLRGYGFESNGSLKLAGADTVRIGGSLQAGETSSIVIGRQRSVLPVALLTDGGFGAYTIESDQDAWSISTTTPSGNVIVSAGVTLSLQQQNLSSTADYSTIATGTRLGQQGGAALALLPDDQRKPVNLTLNAGKVVLDTGSTIVTDPKASISSGAINPDLTLKVSDPTRNVAAKSVELRGRVVDHGGSVFINALATHLGAQAQVDLSGTFIANSRFGLAGGPLTSGTYLAGGTFTVEAGQVTDKILYFIDPNNSNNNKSYYPYAPGPGYGAGYVVADAGATVDVSGAAGTVEVAGARGTTATVWSWSDAGTVSADVQGFAWGGSLVASGGRYVGTDGQVRADPRANKGTFILGGSTNGISLRQDATDVNGKVASFDSKQGGPNLIWLAADQLGSFDNIFLYSGNAVAGAARFFNELPGNSYNAGSPSLATLTIVGSLNWNVGSGLRIAASTITSSPLAGDTTPNVTINAPYVLLTGGGGSTADGRGTFTANARTIDVEGASLSGFARANLISAGDIRLSTPRVSNTVDPNTGASTFPTSFAGSLSTNGDLLFQAQRIYPVSAVDFTIKTPGKVTFAAPAASDTAIPLSAGGSLTVIAKTILQAGNLFAPLGKITLGNLDGAVSSIMTQSVTLAPGSLTSVTLADTTVPYGATLDGTSWYYNASTTPTSLPAKGLILAGANVTRSDGSTVDVRGGGDLQAAEWIQGKGGSRDTLTTTPSGQTVYALLPSQSAAVAAFDVHFTSTRSLDGGKTIITGDVDPLAGTQITIAGGNGIPAGTYTLYPAHYATLPGAMRVVVYGSNLGRNVPTGTTLPDGTVLVTGNVTQSTSPGKQSSGETLFAVQTGAVWQQYSEYSFNSANRFFRQFALKQGDAVPRLPIDAGRLSVSAQESIILNGIALTQPGRDADGNIGRGAELDITAPKMAVIGHAQYLNHDIPTGYVGLDIAQLNDFESIMVGGLRSDPDNNGTTLITPTATSVVVDTGGETFSAPEILLVAAPIKTPQTIAQNLTISTSSSSSQVVNVTDTILASNPNSGTVTIAARSVIATMGIVHAGAGRNYSFGPSAKDVAAALGGTLDANGTVITGADLSKLNISTTNPDNGKAYSHAGTADRMLQDYAAQTGALFVATNDTSLNVTGPAATPLTIQFAPGSAKVLTGSAKTDPVNVNGSLQLSPDGGRVTIWAGANITTKALTLQGTASTTAVVINSNDLHVGQLNLAARSVALGSPTLRTDTGLALYNLQFADVGALAVKALSGTIAIYGDYNPGQSVTNLTLDAAALVRAGDARNAVISDRGTITLVNTSTISTATSSPSAGNDFHLSFNAQQQIILGGGAQSILGYGQVNLNTLGRVYVAGAGSLTLGDVGDKSTDAVKLGIATPAVVVAGATGANDGAFAVTTKGSISLTNSIMAHGLADRPDDSAETGGRLSLVGASISIGTTVQAQAGTISLEAKLGDVTLTERAYLAAAGYKKTIVDVDTYLSGGKVVLTSDQGNITTDKLSVIDVAQPDGGLGYGGEIDMTAVNGNASLAGFLRGSGGAGLGGSFKLDIKGPADLTALADMLKFTALDNQMHSSGGFSGAIDIHTRTGNLVLAENQILKAQAITLTADDTTWVDGDVTKQFGQIYIGGLIDASGYSGSTLDGTGRAGGQVSIFAANSVTLASAGKIDASTHADERGGDVTIGIGWGAKSKIYLQTGTRINVKGGLNGGTVTFRAPRNGNDDVQIAGLSNVRNDRGAFYELPTIDGTNITITGARSLTVDGFVAFDTTSSSHGIDGSTLGWTGGIDPSGWYSDYGKNQAAISGTWTNIGGWQTSIRTSAPFDNAPTGAVQIQDSTGKGSGAALTNFVMGMNSFTADNKSATIPGNSSGTFRITAPAGGRDATGTWSTGANGTVTMSFTDVGAGFVTKPTSATFTLPNGTAQTVNAATTSFFGQIKVLSDLKIVSADVSLPAGGGGYDSTSKLTATLSGSNGTATISFSQASGVGHESNGTFVSDTPIFIPFASSGVFALDPTKQNTLGVANFIGDDQTTDRRFFASTLAQVTQGTWTYNNQSYGLKNLFTRLQPLVDQLGSDVVHVKPGVELVNSSTTINSGNITVVNNWNLAAGTAHNTKTTGGVTSFDMDQSYIDFVYRLAKSPWGGFEAGDLTLRAIANINVNASISDGFFQFGRITSATATTRIIDGDPGSTGSNNGLYKVYLANSNTSLVLPYSDAANLISPTSLDLAAADLFPHTLKVCTSDCSASNLKTVTAPGSWSYTLTAGADMGSANPAARTTLADAKAGDVIVDKHSSYSQPVVSDSDTNTTATTTISLPTMVRTGTGNISIAAARDVILKDTDAPGVIYAAGVNTKLDGFLDPRVQSYGNYGTNFSSGAGSTGTGLYGGPPDAAAFPERGGDVRIDAQRDIKGGYSSSSNKVPQYYQQWLLSYTAPSASKTFGAGVFAPSGTAIPSQTAWWIQYGSFQQGILSAGGNVTVAAGQDLLDVSVSLPTTGRVGGGLSSTSTPVTQLYGSGNMVVQAGRDIRGGSFYEGSGHARIVAGGNIGQNGTISRYQSSPLQLPDVPLLAVDTGQIAMTAGGSVAIAGVVNPAELHAQPDNPSNPLRAGSFIPLYMDTYGPDSKVRVVAKRGDLTISIAPTAITDTSRSSQLQAAASIYPASFEALALNGSLVTTGIKIKDPKDPTGALKFIQDLKGFIPTPGIILSPSEHGTFELLAQNNVDLTFGYPAKPALLDSGSPFTGSRPFISGGSALIDAAFDPYQPNNGQDGASQGSILAHQDDAVAGVDAQARIYAATGDITATGAYSQTSGYQRIQINRPTKIYAGKDIVDLNIIVENIHTSDVSTIAAGGNITYTGYSNGGGLQVAGPGFFVVQAGGDIGPFLPLAHDNASEALVQEGITSVGNASATPVGDIFVSGKGGSVGIYDQSLFGPASNPRRNRLLTDVAGTRLGADIITLFGTKFSVDYQSVINAYVDPANTAKVEHNYLTELQAFLAKVGIATTDGQEAWRKFTNAGKLAVPPVSKDLQQVFADQVFFAELKAVGISQQSGATQFQRGYQAINTMFPSSLGYTANALGGGSNGADQLVKTGDLNLQHGTIQTRLGGDISIFGPGGNILVGPLGLEPNANLKLSDLGILTLGGGTINTFTDGSVRVNSSRVLTTQGGDVLMWSSNADLDAGRGSKTTLSAPALQVQFDQDDYQTVDLSGFVTGAGIATLQASKVAKKSNLYLLAPRGTIDFGTAGVRFSGDAVVGGLHIVNAGNIQGQGTITGLPVISVPDLGALTSGSNVSAAATKPAEVSTASGNRDQASVFIVEVVGYGGGEGQGGAPANGNAKPEIDTARSALPGGGQGQVAVPANANTEPVDGATRATQPKDEEKKKP